MDIIIVMTETNNMLSILRLFRNMIPKYSKHKESKGLAISFVNSSLSQDSFTSLCAVFAQNMGTNPNFKAYRLMNVGYTKLSDLAYPVKQNDDAFALIARAYGSVDYFFYLLEAQRQELQLYANSCIGNRKCMQGLFLMLVAKDAVIYGKRFRKEYLSLRSTNHFNSI